MGVTVLYSSSMHAPSPQDNGVKVCEALGEMLGPEWEEYATRLANARCVRLQCRVSFQSCQFPCYSLPKCIQLQCHVSFQSCQFMSLPFSFTRCLWFRFSLGDLPTVIAAIMQSSSCDLSQGAKVAFARDTRSVLWLCRVLV